MNGSIQREYIDHIFIKSKHHLIRLFKNYFAYYHNDSTHLSLERKHLEAELHGKNRGNDESFTAETLRKQKT